ncbi:MAG TPA: CoA ester lyase [Sphingomicrobium sp.]|nr:CoA ester lyase [Sphingomicrobium sp.]
MNGAEEKSDKAVDLFAVRSVLFLPASNPRAIAKARNAGADLVVLDLEDAVKIEDKDAARAAVAQAVESEWPMPVAIRVNGAGTEWHSLDLDAVARSNADFVTVPRAISAHLIHDVAETAGKPVLAMIETAAGVLAAAGIASEAAGLIAGTNDLRADLRLPLDSTREPISAALQMIVLAARAAGAAVFDGVFNDLEDIAGFEREAEEGRRLGFDGKSLIHPNQIAPCDRAFAPSAAELERAHALIAAFKGGAERFGNEMIERMHIESAERALARGAIRLTK